MGEALDKYVDGLAKFTECSQGNSSHRGDSPERCEDRRASWGAKCLICLFRLCFVLIGHTIRAAICRPHHAASVAQAVEVIEPIRQPGVAIEGLCRVSTLYFPHLGAVSVHNRINRVVACDKVRYDFQ